MNVIFPPEPEVITPPPVPPLVRAARWVGFQFPNLLKQLFQCLVVALMAYCSYLLAGHYVLQSVEVVGVSMFPTLHNHDRCLLNRWTFLFRDPHPSDIVVVRDPSDNSYVVKRIIGRGGDSIYLRSGRVYLNGKLLDEPYLPAGTPTYAPTSRKGDALVICGKDRYYILGDNRKNSIDSRMYGTVPRENILGTILH